MLKILLLGHFATGNLELMYFNAFKEINQAEIHSFDFQNNPLSKRKHPLIKKIIHNRVTYDYFAHQVYKRVKTFLSQKKDYFDVIIIFKGMEFSLDSLEKLKENQKHAFWININPDNPLNIKSIASTNKKVIDSISFFDLYCIWSKLLVEQIKNYGAKKVLYLPFAFDKHYHFPPIKPIPIIKDQVIFIGAWDKEREEILNSISQHNLLIFGNGWDRISKKSLKNKTIFPYNIFLNNLSENIYSSAVSLNIMRSQNNGSHNMRTFEIPAMKGLMLTNRSPEHETFFPENDACYMFNDLHELNEKISHIINNSIEANKVRERGYELGKNYSYSNRALNLFLNIKEMI
jgi:spore maturation protein CgeB